MAKQEVALSGKQIVAASFPVDKRNTRYVAPSRIERTPTGFACTTVTKMPRQRARTHRVRVSLPRDYEGPFNKCREVRVDCDCQRYVFVWNYALWTADAAIRDRTNHKPPVETNPSMETGCCVDAKAWVYTEHGAKRLRDVVVGDKVRTLGGLRAVTESRAMGVRDTLVLQTSAGRGLSVTHDHRILVVNEAGVSWVRADSVRVGDFLVSSRHDTRSGPREELTFTGERSRGYARHAKKLPTEMTPELAELMGLWVAEGSYSIRHPDVAGVISQAPGVTKDRIARLTKKLFNRPGDNSTLGVFAGRALFAWGCRGDSRRKRVPDVIMRADNAVVEAFLCGYYAGDGWFSAGGSFSTVASASYWLARDIQALLIRLGIAARITEGDSGHASTRMYYVRTSDVISTGRAIKRFMPERFDVSAVARSKSVYASGAYVDRVPAVAVEAVLRAYAREVVAALPRDYTPVRAQEVRTRLRREHWHMALPRSVCYPNRDRLGGKPALYTSHGAVLDALEDRLVERALNDVRVGIVKYSDQLLSQDRLRRSLAKHPSKLKKLLEQRLSLFLRDDVLFDRVVDVREGSRMRVHDIGVEGEEHFFADGLCVHNCKHLNVVLAALVKLNPPWPHARRVPVGKRLLTTLTRRINK